MRVLSTGYGKLGKALGKRLSDKRAMTVLKGTPVAAELLEINRGIAVCEYACAVTDGVGSIIRAVAQ